MSRDPLPFELCGDLPSGTTVLEASAGTGKTYTIAALTARLIAEGAAELSELLLVTFGRMATNELRLRVRERLVAVENCLADAVAQRRRNQDAQTGWKGCSRLLSRPSWRVAAAGCPERLLTSTRQPSRPRMSSVFKCSTAWVCSGTASPMPRSLNT